MGPELRCAVSRERRDVLCTNVQRESVLLDPPPRGWGGSSAPTTCYTLIYLYLQLCQLQYLGDADGRLEPELLQQWEATSHNAWHGGYILAAQKSPQSEE